MLSYLPRSWSPCTKRKSKTKFPGTTVASLRAILGLGRALPEAKLTDSWRNENKPLSRGAARQAANRRERTIHHIVNMDRGRGARRTDRAEAAASTLLHWWMSWCSPRIGLVWDGPLKL